MTENEPWERPWNDRLRETPAGGGAGELDGAFHRFRAGVAEKNGIEMRREFLQEGLGEQAAEQRAIHLHHIRQVHFEHIGDGPLDGGVVAADIVDAVAAEEIEVIAFVEIVKIRALGACVDVVESDDALDPTSVD